MEVTVFNVEQGDSFLIQHKDSSYPALLIDTGSATKNVYKKIPNNITELQVLITHSHGDHMNGLPDVIKRFPVSRLYLPFYLPELLHILKILRVKFLNFSPDILDRIRKTPVTLLCAGDYLYPLKRDNFKVLNPQRIVDDKYGCLTLNDSGELDAVINRLNELGFDVNSSDIYDYSPEYFPREGQDEYDYDSREFIKRVFETMSPFVFGATAKNIRTKVIGHLNLISNHISIVLKCTSNTKIIKKTSWLFTGDADKSSFKNIISNDPDVLRSIDVLKVPHHGSNENMDAYLLKYINPKYAIISHKNRRANAKDPHPNIEVINDLDGLGVSVFYTNHVKKNGRFIRNSCYSGNFKALFKFY